MLTKRVCYTFNRGGYYYFTRRVPTDLQQHYLCPRIVQGLNTKCSSTAKSRALVAVAKLDEYWSHLRMTDPKLMGQHMLRSAPTVKVDSNASAAISSISLTEALQTYLTIKVKHFMRLHRERVSTLWTQQPLKTYTNTLAKTLSGLGTT